MISSEVQRTLVKSPPELWAELSDPAQLARHLGELGEIRITRVEPERSLEWEAENTSGTVQIKPSGWGTRVTLTVTRELPEEGAQAAARPASEPMPLSQAEPMPLSQAEPTPLSQAEPAQPEAGADRQADAQPGAEPGTASTWQSELEPPGEIDCDPAWQAKGPASFMHEPLCAAGLERAAAEMQHEDAEAEQEPLGADALQAHPYVWLIDDEPEPRRGFFARLFGRRRRSRGIEPEAIESLGEMDRLSELAEEIAPGDAEPQAPATPHDMEALAPSEADASLAHAPESWQPNASCAPVVAAAPVEEWPAPEQVAPTDQPEDAPAEPVQASGSSSELKAAEEAATAEVTAVLTSALDRLGAAHHRPFSRS
jgi:hypothetical protein